MPSCTRAYTSNNCSGTQRVHLTLTNALSVTGPGTNPNLAERCGINLMLVLDESGSIASSGATGAVRTATKAFLGALSGTGSQVSIIDFSTTAGRPIPYTVVTPESISETFNPYIDNTNRQSRLQPQRLDELGGRIPEGGRGEREARRPTSSSS